MTPPEQTPEPDFRRSVDIGAKYRNHLLPFARIFIPIMFLLGGLISYFIRDQVGIGFGIFGMLLFLLIGILIIVYFGKLAKITEPQSWTVQAGQLSYYSPSKLLGKSFEIPLRDIKSITNEADGESAKILLLGGKEVSFPLETIESKQVYKYLKKRLKKEGILAANKPKGDPMAVFQQRETQ